jgi:hypothetical protein
MITVKHISKKGVNPAMHGIAAKKKGKNFPYYVSLINQMKPIKFLLNTGTICMIKYHLIICILLC